MSGEDNRVHHPPIRDASTLKNVLYGPGHEKFPSWPIAAAAEAPRATRAPPTGSSQRSKSWTDHTNYPKENVVAYTRPYMRRSHSSYPNQLKTVLERCEKNSSETFEYLNRMDRVSDIIERNSGIPSPPERDTQHKRIQDYETLLEDQSLLRYSYDILSKENPSSLTQADLEEYTRNCDEISIQHQKQPSYAQSEGYHSYVSSTDSTSTPFLDRLRRDIDTTVLRGGTNSWDHDSVVTTSSGSASSSETLKWHGSLSDVSVASSSFNLGRQQLIAHSARVQTPQRHNSESVLYIENNRNDIIGSPRSHYASSNCSGSQSAEPQSSTSSLSYSPPSPQRSVAERVHQYEKQATKYTYLDPDKKTKVSDPALKAIQKKALLLFYERHQVQNKSFWKSEPQLSLKSPRGKSKEKDSSDDKLRSHIQTLRENSIQGDITSLSKIQNSKMPCGDCDSHNIISLSKSQNPEPIKPLKPMQKDLLHMQKEHNIQKPVDSRPSFHLGLKSNSQALSAQVKNMNNMLMKNSVDSNPISPVKSFINGSDESYRTLPMKKSSIGFSRSNSENNSNMNYHNFNLPNINSTPAPITCETQNSELQGPIIIGNSISVDDWVPERPPKNQELLRSAFPDLYREKSRYHSPELPLPSPPLPPCEDDALCANDEPFPPPPLEIIDEWKYQKEVLDISLPNEIPSYSKTHGVDFQKPTKHRDYNYIEGMPDVQKKTSNHISKSPVPPTKPKPLKREYPSNHSRVNIASRRNSFANAQDISKDIPILTANIRASVREKSHSQYQPQKPAMSAQRQLYRSVTVDQSVPTPKKPINPFLRSTSMRHDVDHKGDGLSHNFNPEKSIQSERASMQYHYAQKLTLNGKVALATSEKVSKISGQYRAEPLRATFKLSPHALNMIDNKREESPDLHSMWKPNVEPKRLSLPSKYPEPEKLLSTQNRADNGRNSFDGSELRNNTFSFCESDIESISAKTADVRTIYSENIHKSPSHWPCSSLGVITPPPKPVPQQRSIDRITRRHNASISSMSTEHERGSPDVNTGSYKKINVSMEKHIPIPEPKEVIKDIEPPKIISSPVKQDDTTNIKTEEKSISPEKPSQTNPTYIEDANENVEKALDVTITENDSITELNDAETNIQMSPEQNISIDSEVALNEADMIAILPQSSVTKNWKTEKLKPRSLLPEEILWEVLRSHLIVRLSPDSILLGLISQYDECSYTLESITNIFKLELNDNPDEEVQSSTYQEKDEISENDDTKKDQDCSEKGKDTQAITERLHELTINPEINRDDNLESFKNNVCQCLQTLVSALTAESIRLEHTASVNEAVGVQLLATAPKSARLCRHAANVGRVTALIAGLATRLARATRPLKLPVHTPERRKTLMAKQEKLADQLEEAKRLKDNIDARGSALSDTLSTQLSEDFKQQYRRFIANKVKLVVYFRDVQCRLDLAKQLLENLLQDENWNSSFIHVRTQILL